MAMRDDIRKAIEAGGATKESLLALTGTTEKGLASQFTYLRMMGNCPMKQEDGTWKIVSTEEWEAHRSSGSGSAVNLTPEQRVDKAEKRSKRASVAFDSAKTRFEADKSNRLNELKLTKATAELEIAEIELGKAEEVFMAEPAPEVADVDEEYGEYEDDEEYGDDGETDITDTDVEDEELDEDEELA